MEKTISLQLMNNEHESPQSDDEDIVPEKMLKVVLSEPKPEGL